MSITHEAYLNIVPGDSPAPIIKVSQYDADFSIIFHLIAKKRGIVPAYPRTVENDEDVTINVPTSATVSVRGTKTDGNGYSAAATLSGTATAPIVTVAGHEQMTASAGANVYEITFYADNATKRLSTANFILFVEPAALDASTITSESLMLELNDLISSVQNAVEAADRAEAAADQFEIDDTLTQQGKPADAKKVGDEISDIKADFNHIDDALEINYSDVSLWESGGINLPDGQDYQTNTRIRTGYIPRTSKMIKPASGYQIGIYAYNSSDTYLGMYNGTDFSKSEPYWYSSAAFIAEIPASYKLRLLARKDSDSSISTSDATNILFGGSYTDKSLTMSDKAADAKATGDKLRQSDTYQKLLCDDIPDTVQTYTFSAGSVSQVTHSKNGTAIRTDAFTYGESTITEIRTLSTGESLTIVTNLTTLETILTYSSAA